MTPSISGCEPAGISYVKTIARIIEVALACSSGTETGTSIPTDQNSNNSARDSFSNVIPLLDTKERIFANKLIEFLVSVQETMQNDGLLEDQNIVETERGEGVFQQSSLDSNTTSFAGGAIVVNDQDPSPRGINKIQNLELIKVGVLIFVISIIMLTTCRMVFQLFIRFRPEKPQV